VIRVWGEKRWRIGDSREDVDLRIEKGDFISVIGPSGSGKSTLLYNISGMDSISSGNVIFKNQDLTTFSEKELSGLRLTSIGFIFQHIHLLKNLSVFDNVIMSAYLAKNLSRKLINKKASELIEKLGIAEIADNDISQASGGQLQRVGICRALINDPDSIFGDEPAGALCRSSAMG
jgi:putative ABC transport system ATP-binding protein